MHNKSKQNKGNPKPFSRLTIVLPLIPSQNSSLSVASPCTTGMGQEGTTNWSHPALALLRTLTRNEALLDTSVGIPGLMHLLPSRLAPVPETRGDVPRDKPPV